MAIFRSSLLLAALVQAPPATPPAAADTVAAWWGRVRADSTDARAWLLLGRAYLRRASPDTALRRATLDTADLALGRAAALTGGGGGRDSARTFRLFAWGERALLAYRRGGADSAADVWRRLPDGLGLPAELEELGENLLRACPERGLLVTVGNTDTHAASYLRFARRLRPDLTVLPLAYWGDGAEAQLRAAAERRPVCASMGFERPPGRRLKWQARPLAWVSGRTRGARDRVPPGDFAFAALRLALDDSSAWAPRALDVYRRAVRQVPALCRALRTFQIREEVGCK